MSSLPADFPTTLQDAIVYFGNPEKAFAAAIALRWPDGITCPRCGSKEHSFISTRKIWFCKGCKKQFTVKVGSIFEDSPLGMDKWMFATWLVSNCKNGVSSCEVARHLGITQKSAWFMDHRIRAAMQSGSFNKLWGQVEADETYIGGKARNMHADVRARRITGTGGKDKTAVMGILERGSKATGSRVRTRVVDNTKKKTLQAEVREHVLAGSALFTDALKSYEGLNEFQHEVIDHAVEYVRGEVHTNGLENFWSLVKRGLNGTYISVEPYHLSKYLDEQVFRYNNRKGLNDAERFVTVMRNTGGKRLTWKQLTGKTEDPSSAVA
ncbi:MAG: IS1595 family transposase [Bryobacteraceae bacterium]